MALENTILTGIVDFNDNTILENKLPDCDSDNNFKFRQGRWDFTLNLTTMNGCDEIVLVPEDIQVYTYSSKFNKINGEIPSTNITITDSLLSIVGDESMTMHNGINYLIVKDKKGSSWNVKYEVEFTAGYNSLIIPPAKVDDYAKTDLSNVTNNVFKTKGSSSGLALKTELEEIDTKLETKADFSITQKFGNFKDIGYDDTAIATYITDGVVTDSNAIDLYICNLVKTFANNNTTGFLLQDQVLASGYPNLFLWLDHLSGLGGSSQVLEMRFSSNATTARRFFISREASSSSGFVKLEGNNYSSNRIVPMVEYNGAGEKVLTTSDLTATKIEMLSAIIEDDEANGLIVTKKRELLENLLTKNKLIGDE